MKSGIQVAILVALACAAAAVHWVATDRPAGDRAAMKKMLPLRDGERRLEDLPEQDEAGVVWVDAREEGAWRRDGLPGSIHLSMSSQEPLAIQIERELEALGSARMVVIYCDDARCGLSHDLAAALKRDYAGLIDGEIVVLHGGAEILREAGRLRSSNPDS